MYLKFRKSNKNCDPRGLNFGASGKITVCEMPACFDVTMSVYSLSSYSIKINSRT